jgi:hypothetical protein
MNLKRVKEKGAAVRQKVELATGEGVEKNTITKILLRR